MGSLKTCNICGRERAAEDISERVIDLSANKGMPAGSIVQRVRYCVDDEVCVEGARIYAIPEELRGGGRSR